MAYPPNPLTRPSDRLISILTQVRNLQKRIAAFGTGLTSTSKAVNYVYEQRHREIFPPGFDYTSPGAKIEHSYYPFALERLYNMLTNDYNPNNRVESIVVKSALYCKQTRSPQHEFIMIEVEDTKAPGLKNVIVLDRNNGNVHGQTAGILSSLQTSASINIAARDEFRVSYDGNRARLLSQCSLNPHETLEEIVFHPDEPLFLYQLATLAWMASVERERYQLLTANCYWFAGLIWDCMIRIRSKATHRCMRGNMRGKFRTWLRQTTDAAELDVISDRVEAKLLAIELDLTKRKHKWSQGKDLDLKQEIEKKRREVEELMRQLNDESA